MAGSWDGSSGYSQGPKEPRDPPDYHALCSQRGQR